MLDHEMELRDQKKYNYSYLFRICPAMDFNFSMTIRGERTLTVAP